MFSRNHDMTASLGGALAVGGLVAAPPRIGMPVGGGRASSGRGMTARGASGRGMGRTLIDASAFSAVPLFACVALRGRPARSFAIFVAMNSHAKSTGETTEVSDRDCRRILNPNVACDANSCEFVMTMISVAREGKSNMKRRRKSTKEERRRRRREGGGGEAVEKRQRR